MIFLVSSDVSVRLRATAVSSHFAQHTSRVRRRTSLERAYGEGRPHRRRCVMALILKPLFGFIASTGALTTMMVLISHVG
jgi:hypothetical protein